MSKWQQKYIKNESLKIAQLQQQEKTVKDIADLLYKVAYEKFIIDRQLKKTTIFELPTVDAIYKVIEHDPEYTKKITRIGHNKFICHGCDSIIYSHTIDKALEYNYTGYLSNSDKFYILCGLLTVCILAGCIIYGIFNFIVWLSS